MTRASGAALLLCFSWSAHAEAQLEGNPAPPPAGEPKPPPSGEPGESWLVPSLHGLGLMFGMRVGEAIIWPDPFADFSLSRMGDSYRDAYTLPPKWDSSAPVFEWDGDPWYVNAIGHALFGSELYLRARTCKKGVLPALLFTAAGSTLWEYGIEAASVRPSGLDLWYTPAAGLFLGELRYLGWSAARRGGGVGRAFATVLDPFGELERALGTEC